MTAAPAHRCRVLLSPWPGLYAVETWSARHYGRHSHGTYGFGVLDAGAHRSSSDRRTFDAFAGDILATNPGEMHDGRPLGGRTRRWHTVYLDSEVLSAIGGLATVGDVRITRAAFADAALQRAVRDLLAKLEDWQQGSRDAFACEEALVQACGLLLARHATGDERYLSFGGEVERPDPGEVSFVDAAGNAHARRWTHRQSGLSAVRAETSEVLIVAEAMHAGGTEDIARLVEAISESLREVWGVAPQRALLSAQRPVFTLTP